MNRDVFWQLIDGARGLAAGNPQRQLRILTAALRWLSDESIEAFQQHMDECMNEACRPDLRAAACILQGSCGDHAFQRFRGWLISLGPRVYDQVLQDPDSLAGIVDATSPDMTSFEEFHDLAARIYKDATGDDPIRISPVAFDPAEPWQRFDNDLQHRFPQLWAKFAPTRQQA